MVFFYDFFEKMYFQLFLATSALLLCFFPLKLICAMKVIETGQDWKIAALRSSFHVHFLFGGMYE